MKETEASLSLTNWLEVDLSSMGRSAPATVVQSLILHHKSSGSRLFDNLPNSKGQILLLTRTKVLWHLPLASSPEEFCAQGTVLQGFIVHTKLS